MENFLKSYRESKNLHHAYFFIGKGSEVSPELYSFFDTELGVRTLGNPDFQHREFTSFTIDDARELSLNQEAKDFSGGKKVFIIETEVITPEAQNAMLKVFEEPTPGTHFFIISPQDILLPTLRSRMQVITLREGERPKTDILSLNLKDRLSLVKEITEGISDEEKTKQDAISFLNDIESELYERGVEMSADSLAICENARQSLYDRGAPVKMILENTVLSV